MVVQITLKFSAFFMSLVVGKLDKKLAKIENRNGIDNLVEIAISKIGIQV